MGIIFFPCREKKLCILVIKSIIIFPSREKKLCFCDLLRAQSIMWLLHPSPRANGNYAALGTHYAALGLHCAALGLPRPPVYGSPLAAQCNPLAA